MKSTNGQAKKCPLTQEFCNGDNCEWFCNDHCALRDMINAICEVKAELEILNKKLDKLN